MTDRRGFLERLATLPVVGPLLAGTRVGTPTGRDFLKELNVQPIINAAGSYTMFTGSLLRPEVVRAYESISKRFVRLDELHDAVGKRIASMLGVEAAMVPSGAAGGLLAGTAACITGKDPEKIAKIPHIPGMKNEAIVQKSHRFPYDHLVRACGVRLIEIETSEELERALSPRTAHLLFLNKAEPQGRIKAEEFVALGRKHGIPTFNDAAADVPPLENLTRPIKLGFDLIAISGGKCIRGPQSAGLLLGRKDLIEAARLNSPPNSDTIGRASKVNKEEMVAMMVAVEVFLKEDQKALYREWERSIEIIERQAAGVAGVTAERFMPEIANQTPHLRLTWDASKIRLTPKEVMQKLREGEPSIELVPGPSSGIEIASHTLQAGEPEIVGRRLREILKA